MKITKLKEYALQHQVPIIQDEGLDFIIELIKSKNIKTILEIGSAIGYSAISFSQVGCIVDTIEKDENRYNEAVKNIKEFNANVNIHLADALTFETNKLYDLIFIDGPKGQYERLFLRFSPNLKAGGVIVCDNLNFHHLKVEDVSKRTASLLNKIKKFRQFLTDNKEYETVIYDVGDGVSVSKLK